MELFKLFGTIAVDNSDAKKAINETTGEAEESQGKLNKVFGAIGKGAVKVAKLGAEAVAAGASVAGALVKSSVEAYAEYEQLVGGVETLFKDSANQVMAFANNAYKTAGMSANEYMETVTGFSASLLQSLGGDTQKAADRANLAITDMSDNANKMGTSMESIQNAYQGFAKQNYTMLDNLKLGYGGTKEEMERLLADANKINAQYDKHTEYSIKNYSDIISAIHVVQTEMGITGTTAKEAASTISGSLGMAKAAWSNLVVGISDDTQDFDTLINNFVDSVTTAGKNILPRVRIAIEGVGKLINSLMPTIAAEIPKIIEDVLPGMLSAGTSLITSLLNGLIAALPELVEGARQIINALIEFLINNLPMLVSAAAQIVWELVNGIIQALPQFVEAGFQIITTLLSGITENIPQILTTIVNVVFQILESFYASAPQLLEAGLNLMLSLADGILQAIPDIIARLPELINSMIAYLSEAYPQVLEAFETLLMSIVDALPDIMEALIQNLPTIIQAIVQFLADSAPEILEQAVYMFMELVVAIGEILPELIEQLVYLLATILDTLVQPAKDLFSGIWDFIVEIFSGAKQWWEECWDAVIEAVMEVVSPVIEFFQGIWDSITEVFSDVANWFGNIFKKAYSGITSAFSGIGNFFSSAWSKVTNAFKSVATWFGNIFKSAWTNIKNAFSPMTSFFSNIWTSIKNTFSKVGEVVGNAITNTVKTAVNGVLSVAVKIINGFISAINLAISVINAIPGVSIDKLDKLNVPQLAKGGVLEKGQVGLLEGNGAEAVVPLDQNRKWISKVAEDMKEETGSMNNATLEEILSLLKNFMDTLPDTLVDALAAGVKFEVSKREVARLVKAVN